MKTHWTTLTDHPPSPLQELDLPLLRKKKVRLWVKRDDLLRLEGLSGDTAFQGNKWRKLQYNLLHARAEGHPRLLTFGGAYSNHIAATASAGYLFGFQTIGIIRGEEHLPLNPTLRRAAAAGMHFHYLDRTTYRRKNEADVQQQLQHQFPDALFLPEGGTNKLALKGCENILTEIYEQGLQPDYICLSAGTGGTAAGVIRSRQQEEHTLVFPALKGDFMKAEIATLLENPTPSAWHTCTDYHFGGYAKSKPTLLTFIDDFYKKTAIPLERIYTGKLFYGLLDKIEKGDFPVGSKIVAIHTGGLQVNQN